MINTRGHFVRKKFYVIQPAARVDLDLLSYDMIERLEEQKKHATHSYTRRRMSTMLMYFRRNHHEGCHPGRIIKPYGESTGCVIPVTKDRTIYIQFIVEDNILYFIIIT